MFYDAPPRSRYSFPEMIVVSELKSTLRSSSHLSTISRRSEDVKNAQSSVVYKTRTVLKILLGLQIIHSLYFSYEEFFYFEGRFVDFAGYRCYKVPNTVHFPYFINVPFNYRL